MNHLPTADAIRQKIKLIENQLDHPEQSTDTDELCERLEALRKRLAQSAQTQSARALTTFNRMKFSIYRRTAVKFRKHPKIRVKRKRNRSTRIKAPPADEPDENSAKTALFDLKGGN